MFGTLTTLLIGGTYVKKRKAFLTPSIALQAIQVEPLRGSDPKTPSLYDRISPLGD
jgi:hypothetical protein